MATRWDSKHTGQKIDDTIDYVTNPNLLDNWYFGNPVNQRGKTEYAVAGYTIDRWKASSTSVVLNVSNRKLTFNAQSHSFRQYIENPKNYAGKTVTVSILGKVTGSIILQLQADDNTFAQKYISSTDAIELWSVSGKVPDTVSSNLQIVIMSNTANSSIEDFLAAKFELGSQQTLAHQDADGNWVLNEIPDYSEQLVRCQRYYRASFVGEMTAYGAPYFIYSSGSPGSQPVVHWDTPMRTNPVVTVYSGNGELNKVRDWILSSNINITGANYISSTGFSIYGLSGLTAGRPYTFHYTASADL